MDDREARLEEIRERLVRFGYAVYRRGADTRETTPDLRWLLSEIDRLREASGILLDVLEDMKPSGVDVPAELDYAIDDLRRALHEGEDHEPHN